MRVAVAGGTGVVGKYVLGAAQAAGHDATSLSRASGIDLTTGVGLEAALAGVEVIIDATNPRSISRKKATAFFISATGHLHSAGASAGVARLVTISIVGIDRARGYGYYEAKLAQEGASLAGPIPASIVRATQFHEFAGQIMHRSKALGLAAVPHMTVQTIAARSVGEVAVEVATSPPEPGSILEVAGPDTADLPDLARRLVAARSLGLRVVPLKVPGELGRTMRSGALAPGGSARIVGPTFEEWLSSGDAEALVV